MEYVLRMKDLPNDALHAKGLRNRSLADLNKYQQKCVRRLTNTIQIEQESYLVHHPEINAMMKASIAEVINNGHERRAVAFVAEQLTRPVEELDKRIREQLQITPDEPYNLTVPEDFEFSDKTLMGDLAAIHARFHPIIRSLPESVSDNLSLPTTKSSSFLSIVSSQSTRLTQESTPVLSLTTSEVFYGLISKIVDKAILLHVEPYQILYDTAYVEIMNAVENAMEITVSDIKADIVAELEAAYEVFTMTIIERAKIIAERNWERRMRKKLKTTLRREENFKGYKTPPTPKSELSSHESYKKPPPRPCKCHPQFHYNRYPKDRFGVYLPREEQFSNESVSSMPMMP